jgi:hypothetical protein
MPPIRVLLPGVMVLIAGARVARADEAGSAAAMAEHRVHVAVGVNPPQSWLDGHAIGASLYVGISERHAIRANVARYQYRGLLGDTIPVILGAEEVPSYSGHTTDLGISLVYHPRRLWRGFTWEIGALRRARDHRIEQDDADSVAVATRTTEYAGRGMIGWSWLVFDHVFVAISGGLSVGHESGTETSGRRDDAMPVQTKVSRLVHEFEGMARLGVAFDL